LMVQFPNSKFAPEAQQKLRQIQEVLAEGEFRTGSFYHTKGSFPAAANRLHGLTDQYPLFSQADEGLWLLGESYVKMGDRFEDKAADAYTRIVREYPLSLRVDEAKQKLQAMNRPIPEPDPVAYARMKYELENREKVGMMSHFWGVFRKSPDVRAAAKSGEPVMSSLRPRVPATVPSADSAAGAPTGDVTVSAVTDPTALDTKPDARQAPPGQPPSAAVEAATPADSGAAEPASDRQNKNKKKNEKKKKNNASQ